MAVLENHPPNNYEMALSLGLKVHANISLSKLKKNFRRIIVHISFGSFCFFQSSRFISRDLGAEDGFPERLVT
jgi:hypothetical protein